MIRGRTGNRLLSNGKFVLKNFVLGRGSEKPRRISVALLLTMALGVRFQILKL